MEDGPLYWIFKRRGGKDRSQPLGVVLGGLAGSIWFKQQKHLGRIVQALRELLPDELADHLAIEGLKRNTLHVRVDSAAHRYELELIKESLLESLNGQVNGLFIRDIRFSLGPLEGPWHPTPRKPAAVDRYEN